MYDSIVIGGGQAGLAAGYHLQRKGLKFTALEAGAQATGSWSRYYKSLQLFSPARYSSLPGLPFPGDPERYPSREEVIAYLKQYQAHFKLPVLTEAQVERVEKNGNTFLLHTSKGHFEARTVVVASGAFSQPSIPAIEGQQVFTGHILHSAEYQEPQPFAGKRIVVVGAGNSAVQIAVELAQVANVTLTSREPVVFRQQRPWGRDIHFWITITGFDTFTLPSFLKKATANDSANPRPEVLDTGKYAAALEAGRPNWKPMFREFTASGVRWTNGEAETIDTVIFATGFRPNVPYLADTDALDREQRPIHRDGISVTVPGLYYVGLSYQRSHASATIRGVGADANFIMKPLQRYLKAWSGSNVQVSNPVSPAS
jgi:putative flavoprotein involved in K+ transport